VQPPPLPAIIFFNSSRLSSSLMLPKLSFFFFIVFSVLLIIIMGCTSFGITALSTNEKFERIFSHISSLFSSHFSLVVTIREIADQITCTGHSEDIGSSGIEAIRGSTIVRRSGRGRRRVTSILYRCPPSPSQ